MSASRNVRLAWLAQQLTEGKSNGAIILDCMTKFPGVSEKVARKDLKEILQRFAEIDSDTLELAKQRYLEIGWKLLEECRSLSQMGPAVTQFKNLATIAGVLNEKAPEKQEVAPESNIIRERITQLMKNKAVREKANEIGLDLKDLSKKDND